MLSLLCGIVVVSWMVYTVVARVHVEPKSGSPDTVKLVSGSQDKMALSSAVINSLGIHTVEVKPAVGHDKISLSGSLFLDPNRMVRVHTRFAGEVVSIGPAVCDDPEVNRASPLDDPTAPNSGKSCDRPLRLGDRCKKGQLLAVIWSKDVGEKKSDLVNALSQLYLDQSQLERLRKLDKGVVPERTVREAERQYEADVISVERVERTLRSWRLTENEIQEVRGEAHKIHTGEQNRDVKLEKSWAEVDVRAPFEGIVLEKNITVGDIVDTDLDLFKIADLNTLGVLANIYEEDLPAVESLPRDQRKWTIYLKSQTDAPGMPGTFELIGNIIDPNQHTAAIMGWIPNPGGKLRVGQFIKAVIEFPSSPYEVAVPENSLIEEGRRNTVFVAQDGDGRVVERRSVAVVRRGPDVAYVRAEPNAEERAEGCKSLRPGEWVIAGATVEIAGALDDLLAAAPAVADTKK